MATSVSRSKQTITDPDLPVFCSISSVLTHFSQVGLEGTGMLEEYFYILMKEQDHEEVRAFLRRAKDILDTIKDPLNLTPTNEATVRSAFYAPFDPAVPSRTPFEAMPYQGLAQRIILLWVDGTWTTMNDKDTKSEQDRTVVPSARAYQQALKWAIAETHPAGAKQPGFNSWSAPPV
jgi:hypothetical protein